MMNQTMQEQSIAEAPAQPTINALRLANQLGNNVVQVFPGGTTFTSIQSAINSIQNATPEVQYQVCIGPGNYNEQVILKHNVYLTGAGMNVTTVTAPGTSKPAGALMIGGNCGASMMTINCEGSAVGGYCSALYAVLDCTFMGAGLTLHADDNGYGNSVVATISNLAGSPNATFNLANCTINAISSQSSSTVMGAQVMGPQTNLNIELSTIAATNPASIGVITASGATAVLTDCTVTGQNYSLCNDDQKSPITANGCTLNGQVNAGVIVNP